jgi:hypothetical protein
MVTKPEYRVGTKGDLFKGREIGGNLMAANAMDCRTLRLGCDRYQIFSFAGMTRNSRLV